MSSWYYAVVRDLNKVPDFIEYFENEIEDARKELSLKGKTIEKHGSEMPGITEHRFGQLQEIEAVLEYLNTELRKIKTATYRKFLENYNRSLSSRDADKFADGEPDVVNMSLVVNEVALLRNKFLGIVKGIDQKGWMIGHITKLRAAGLEDAEIR